MKVFVIVSRGNRSYRCKANYGKGIDIGMNCRITNSDFVQKNMTNNKNLYRNNGLFSKNTSNNPNGVLQTKEKIHDIRKMLNGQRNKNASQNNYSTYLNEQKNYGELLSTNRAKTKKTALTLKKLRYNFKGISSQIMRSKTSANARQVAGKARREVIRLKRQRQNGEYDEEELQAAITHAQAMERVAKKKARHLQEEEMIKIAGGACMGSIEEEYQKDKQVDLSKEESSWAEESQDENLQSIQTEGWEDVRAFLESEMADITSEVSEVVMEEMWEAMKELLEEMGLEELNEAIVSVAKEDMDPADIKMMKIKHRSSELKAIAKADAKYLKAVFDRMEKVGATAFVPEMMNMSVADIPTSIDILI